MTDKELTQTIDEVREDLISRHPEDYDAIDTTCVTIAYELRKKLNN